MVIEVIDHFGHAGGDRKVDLPLAPARGGVHLPSILTFRTQDDSRRPMSLVRADASEVPVPPCDVSHLQVDQVPVVAGVDLEWSVSYFDSPFGRMHEQIEVLDGRPVAISCGLGEPPDRSALHFDIPYDRYLQARLGWMEWHQSLAGGRLVGEVEEAMVLAGLLNGAWFACHPVVAEELVAIEALVRLLKGKTLRSLG
jgi:hypothetical protein